MHASHKNEEKQITSKLGICIGLSGPLLANLKQIINHPKQ